MIYMDIINNDTELLTKKELEYSNLLKKIIIFYRKRTKYISIKNEEYGEFIRIQKLDQKTLMKLEKILNVNSVKNIYLSKRINNEIDEILKKNKIIKKDGNDLKIYLIEELLEYICLKKDEILAKQEVSFMINNNNPIISFNIQNVAKKVKNINVITNDFKQFKTLEQKLYQENGIILNISNNYKKSLLNSNVIINIDFSSEEMNKYLIPKYTCIYNLKKENITYKKGFEGINIEDFKYVINKNMKIKNSAFKQFDNELLYESLILKNSNPINVFNSLKNDNVQIVELYGKNGIIRKKEFEKLKRLNIR